MEIKIGKYVLTSDTYQYIVEEQTKIKTGKNKGDTVKVGKTYHSSISSALKSIIDRKIKESDATTVKELLNDIEKIYKEIDEVFEFESFKPVINNNNFK